MLSIKSRPLPILNHLLAALPSEEYERLIPNLGLRFVCHSWRCSI